MRGAANMGGSSSRITESAAWWVAMIGAANGGLLPVVAAPLAMGLGLFIWWRYGKAASSRQ